MNRKRRSKICCLSGILLLILLLAGVQRVSAMTTRTELYQNTPSDGGRSGGKEKQLLANSYAGEYQIDFSYGFEGNYQDGNHVPIRVTITNESAVEFEGYFVFQIKNAAESIYRGNSGEGILSKLFPGVKRSGDGRNSLFTYRFPIYIPANGTVNKIDIPATKSQFEARKALVYLPPAALADSKRKPALPVVLMLSGQPGSPGRVFQAGGIQTMMDGYAKTHDGLAPIVIAADQLGADSHNTLCVDSKVYGNALTYLTQDVVDWVKTNLPAAQDAKDWAIAGFSQGATCSLQIGVNHPDLFGTMIPTDSEIKPTNGSRQEMIDRFFDGDTTAYENQVPVNAIRNHAPTHQMLIIGAGEKDTTSIRNVKTIAPVAAKAGMRVAAVESSGNAHDWHAVQDVLRYGLAVFGHDTGLDGANPNLSDYPNLKRITI